MFGLGVWEVVVIALVALVVLGPERLPKLARQLGRGMREFRRAANELQNTLEEAADAEETPARPSIRPAPGAQPHSLEAGPPSSEEEP